MADKKSMTNSLLLPEVQNVLERLHALTTAPLPKPANLLPLDQIKMVAQATKRIRLRGSRLA